MGGCSVRGCRSTSGNGITFSRLPSGRNDTTRRHAWCKALGRPEDWKSATSFVVCERHFLPEDWEKRRQDGSIKLRTCAVPSVNLSPQLSRARNAFSDITNSKSTTNTQVHVKPQPIIIEVPSETLGDENQLPLSTFKTNSGVEVKAKSVIIEVPAEKFLCDNGLPTPLPSVNSISREHSYAHAVVKTKSSELLSPEASSVSSLPHENSQLPRLTSTPVRKPPVSVNHISDVSPISASNFSKSTFLNDTRTHSSASAISDTVELEFKSLLARLAQAEEENKILKARASSVEKLTNEVFSLRRVVKRERQVKGRLQKHINLSKQNLSRILSDDQYQSTMRVSTQGMKFSNISIQEGLVFKSQCGSTAYENIAKRFALPTGRCLNQRTEHIKFHSGILHEVIQQLEKQVPSMCENEKDCVIALDEMALTANDRLFDRSTKSPIGNATLPGHTGPASKALAIMIGGITTRWKILIAYYFTSSKEKKEGKQRPDKGNTQGNYMKGILLTIISLLEKIGLKISAIVSDMGPDNRAMWKAFDMYGKKTGNVKVSIVHPCSPDRELHILPDGPHIFKSVVQMLMKNKFIVLPQDIVDKYCLPSKIVNIDHIKELMKHEENYELKVAFRLQEESFKNGHFDKMKVAVSRSIFNHRTKVGLELLAKKTGVEAYRTTAWFVGLFVRWADLTTSRCPSLALSKKNTEAYDLAIAHIVLTSYVFQTMVVGAKGDWKPAQEGVMMVSHAILKLQEYYLNKRGYHFLLTSRFTQDFVENFFSQIRRRQAIPNALMFKSIARELTIAGICSRAPRGSSYDDDEAVMLLSLLPADEAEKSDNAAIASSVINLNSIHCPRIQNEDIYQVLDDWELQVVYDMAGAAVHSLMDIHKLSRQCPCIASLLWKGPSHHPLANVTLAKNYKEGAQLEVSDECFVAITKCEIIFRIMRSAILKEKDINVFETICGKAAYVWESFMSPSCHADIMAKLCKRFFTIRFKQYGGKAKISDQCQKATAVFASKSLAMRELTKNLVVTGNRK